ncbi:type II toxin-antitoxin system RelE/ParE family toxin [Fibrisoma montanum]|uniref:Type II toxin-antitoxin system RelE/ParE family toxin n=1 Tax=Fibrisoma montanum TaxID=2305895 RepID=A0A418LWZ7_9BACT|nr:type II toxin-antitoxin system RelE/ParE family toxin [Fibrisoma montanum]
MNWKESAREEVREIYSFLLNLSMVAADEWLEQLEKKLNLIEQFPGMGRMVPDYYISFIREVFVGSYRIVYSIQDDTPLILAVRPMSRPLGRI